MLSLLAIIPIFFILLLNQNVIDICAEAADKLHKKHPLIYVYDWPELLDVYANYTDRDHSSHGVEFPEWTSNKGTGRIIDARRMEHKTSQFSLFKIIYERMLVSEYRTYDITKATTFFIPFDIGMHAAFLKANGRMRRSDCPLYEQVKKRLNSSVYFQRNYGHDHILVNSVNQNLNYFLRAPNCVAIIQLCWNCTKLSIDEYMFIAKDREFELKDRGINWHAVPFPSDYHYRYSSRYNYNNGGGSSKAPWAENIYDRSTIVSFVGGSRRFNQIATDIREALIKQCQLHSKECSFDTYKHGKNERGLHKLSRQSTFCFQVSISHILISNYLLLYTYEHLYALNSYSLLVTCQHGNPCLIVCYQVVYQSYFTHLQLDICMSGTLVNYGKRYLSTSTPCLIMRILSLTRLIM